MTAGDSVYRFDRAPRRPARRWPPILAGAVVAAAAAGLFAGFTAFSMLTDHTALRPILLRVEMGGALAGAIITGLVLLYANAMNRRLPADGALGVILASALIAPLIVAGTEQVVYDQGWNRIAPRMRAAYRQTLDGADAYDQAVVSLGLEDRFRPATLAHGFDAAATRAGLVKAREADAAFSALSTGLAGRTRAAIVAVPWVKAWKDKVLADFDRDFRSKDGGLKQLRATQIYRLGMIEYETTYLARGGWKMQDGHVQFVHESDTRYFAWAEGARSDAGVYIYNIGQSFEAKAHDLGDKSPRRPTVHDFSRGFRG